MKRSKKDLNYGILTLMEFGLDYSDVLLMPYPFFEDTLDWKREIQEKRNKEIEEKIREKEQNRNKNQQNRRNNRR
ncbi:MAG: hypothetical protein ACOCQD_03720 [archaeon]